MTRQSTKDMLVQAVYGHRGGDESDTVDGLIEHLTDSLCTRCITTDRVRQLADARSDGLDGLPLEEAKEVK